MKITIAFTVYNRPDYLKTTLDSWLKVRNKNKHGFIFKVEASDKLEEVLSVIESFKNNIGVPVGIIINDPKSGVGKNQQEALSISFDGMNSDATIMAEDDIIVSNDIIEYFEYVFSKYEHDEEVLAACSHRYTEGDLGTLIIKDKSFDPWIWGIWKAKWEKYLKNDWDLEQFKLGDRVLGGFDYHIVYRILPKHGLVSVFPSATRSKHIGINGTYSRDHNYFDNPYFTNNHSENIFNV